MTEQQQNAIIWFFFVVVIAEDCTKQNGNNNKQQLTTKWKRDRRSRLPEYSRKSDPKIPEVFNQPSSEGEQQQQMENGAGNSDEKCTNGEQIANKDIPLDMSIRHRGQPPSYAQTISNPGYRSSYRPSVIQNSVPPRDDIPSGEIFLIVVLKITLTVFLL